MKLSTKALLITILCISAAPALAKNGLCVQRGVGGQCEACYLSKPNQTTKDCGPVEANGNCTVYFNFRKNPICQICKPGYAASYIGQMSVVCKKDDKFIKNCFDETNLGFKACQLCNGGYPDIDTQRNTCLPFATGGKNIENCLVGFSPTFKEIDCYRCKDGYSYDFQGKKCIQSDSGCLSFTLFEKKKTCLGCNVYAGYSATKDGTCSKVNQCMNH